jgi:hypothetical protein
MIIRMVRLGECKVVSRFQTSIGQQKGNVLEEKKILSLIRKSSYFIICTIIFRKLLEEGIAYVYNLFVEEY